MHASVFRDWEKYQLLIISIQLESKSEMPYDPLYKLWFIGSFFQKHGLTLSGKRRNPCPQNANPDANCCLASIFQNLPQGGHLCQMRPQGDRRGKEGQQLSLLVVQWLPIQDTCESKFIECHNSHMTYKRKAICCYECSFSSKSACNFKQHLLNLKLHFIHFHFSNKKQT